MHKEAIAVFSPTDPIEALFQDSYHKASGQWMTAEDMRLVMRSLPLYRGLATKVRSNPREVASILFGETNDRPFWYYPCDIVELRQLLSDKQIAWHAPIALLGYRSAQKLMSQYPVCLVLDRNAVKPLGRSLGGTLLLDTSRLHLGDAVQRIILRTYLSEHQVNSIYKIIKDTYGYIPTHLMHDLPGMAYEKVAAAQTTNTRAEGLIAMAQNWYTQVKTSTGPDETFDKPFLIGKLPKEGFDEEDVAKTRYTTEQEAIDWKVGDRGVYRYTDLKLPAWTGAKTKNIPMTRSLIQKPVVFTVRKIDNKHITIKLDDAKDEQDIPLDQAVFLMKLK